MKDFEVRISFVYLRVLRGSSFLSLNEKRGTRLPQVPQNA